MSIKAIILAGGRSTRLGKDKSQLDWHGLQQELHLARLCRRLGLDTYISKAHDFLDAFIGEFPVIKDRYNAIGPLGAICSACMHDPTSSWLVLACDLPLIQVDVIQALMDNRNPAVFATVIQASNKDFPEPLIAIYEPAIYPKILQLLADSTKGPIALLKSLDIEVLDWDNEEQLINVNTPEDLDQARKLLD